MLDLCFDFLDQNCVCFDCAQFKITSRPQNFIRITARAQLSKSKHKSSNSIWVLFDKLSNLLKPKPCMFCVPFKVFGAFSVLKNMKLNYRTTPHIKYKVTDFAPITVAFLKIDWLRVYTPIVLQKTITVEKSFKFELLVDVFKTSVKNFSTKVWQKPSQAQLLRQCLCKSEQEDFDSNAFQSVWKKVRFKKLDQRRKKTDPFYPFFFQNYFLNHSTHDMLVKKANFADINFLNDLICILQEPNSVYL